MPDNQPRSQQQNQPPLVTPPDNHPPPASPLRLGRFLIIAVWLILSGIVVFYLIRMFGRQ